MWSLQRLTIANQLGLALVTSVADWSCVLVHLVSPMAQLLRLASAACTDASNCAGLLRPREAPSHTGCRDDLLGMLALHAQRILTEELGVAAHAEACPAEVRL